MSGDGTGCDRSTDERCPHRRLHHHHGSGRTAGRRDRLRTSPLGSSPQWVRSMRAWPRPPRSQGDPPARYDPAPRFRRPPQPPVRLRRRDAVARDLDRPLRRLPHVERRDGALHEARCRDPGPPAPALERRRPPAAGRPHADRGRPGPLLPEPARPGRGQLGASRVLQLRHDRDARLGPAPTGRARRRSYGRTADGKLDGCAYEMPAVMQVARPSWPQW